MKYLSTFLLTLVVTLPITPARESHWFKGNTHTHSLWSDGNDFPEMIARFYKEEGYQFLVLSDHNRLSRGEKWLTVAEVERRRKGAGASTLSKYLAAYGAAGVERKGEGEAQQVRLKTLEEIRPEFEEAGKFLFVEGEEITDHFEQKQVHINALNLDETIAPQHGDSLRATMQNNLRAVREQEKRLQRPILAHLNHPNYRWSITAEDLAHVVEEQFFEVFNGASGAHVIGDKTHPGTEKIWDIANTIRMAELDQDPLYGLATDDAHSYHGGRMKPGRGWIVVRAEKLQASNLIQAMRAGDFYASTGVHLKKLSYDRASRKLSIEIDPVEGEQYNTCIFGTRRGNENDLGKVGEVLATVRGTKVSYLLPEDVWYIRATITSDAAHPVASYPGQVKQAWTQPVWK